MPVAFAYYHLCHLCQMVDVVENEAKMAYMRPPGGSAAAMDERGPSKGFVVREAPWTTANEKVSIFSHAPTV